MSYSVNDHAYKNIYAEIKAYSYKQKHAILAQLGYIQEDGREPDEMELDDLCYDNKIYASKIQQY